MMVTLVLLSAAFGLFLAIKGILKTRLSGKCSRVDQLIESAAIWKRMGMLDEAKEYLEAARELNKEKSR